MTSAEQFPVFTMPVKIYEQDYTSYDLLPRLLRVLKRARLYRASEGLLLAGVNVTPELSQQRTHGERFSTQATSVDALLRLGIHADDEEDPFKRADKDGMHTQPGIMVYDEKLLETYGGGIDDTAFSVRYHQVYGVSPYLNEYGVAEGNLDAATCALVVMSPVESTHRK